MGKPEAASRVGHARTRVLIADADPIRRHGLRLIIGQEPDLEVAAEARGAQDALARAGEASPDVIILALAMRRSDDRSVIRRVRRTAPAARVLILAPSEGLGAYARAVEAAGASALLAKGTTCSELLAAIRAQRREAADDGPVPSSGAGGPGATFADDGLSPREQQVFGLLALGHTHREIAARLGIGIKTVETYRGRIGQKLGLSSRADIVAYALETGVLTAHKPVSDAPEA
jgi:two-component system response regulator NreC